MWQIIVLPIFICLLVYFLYQRGYGWVRSGSAWMVFPKWIKNGVGHSFSSASYQMKKIKRFKEDGPHTFELQTDRQHGELMFRMYDEQKNEVLCLDSLHPRAVVDIIAHRKYTFQLKTTKFTGTYSVLWDRD